VIDDDVSGARAIARLLKVHGHVVDVADSLAAAERASAVNPPDVVLSDLQLAWESGLDAPPRVAATVAQGGRPAPPAVVVSGFASPEDLARSRAAGFAAHLVKPVNELQLLRALRHAVDGVEQWADRASGLATASG
jgi:two-component system CheB/CheR fusion protein